MYHPFELYSISTNCSCLFFVSGVDRLPISPNTYLSDCALIESMFDFLLGLVRVDDCSWMRKFHSSMVLYRRGPCVRFILSCAV